MVKKFVLIFGIVYAIIGILGYIPAFVTPPEVAGDPTSTTAAEHVRLFGIFPVNFWHNLFHLGVGIWGIFASRDFNSAVNYSRITAVLFAILAVFGFFPALNVLFGLAPIYGHDIWLHAVTAALTGYFGFAAPARVKT